MMLLATPIDGSHYLTDVLAGIALGLLCLIAAQAMAARAAADKPGELLRPILISARRGWGDADSKMPPKIEKKLGNALGEPLIDRAPYLNNVN